jgi:hypothetical protein
LARIGKLYKLIKITRLFRLFKLMKNEGKLFKKIGEALNLGEATERLWFFGFILILLSHIFGCCWIFVGRNFADDGVSWISENFAGDKTGG